MGLQQLGGLLQQPVSLVDPFVVAQFGKVVDADLQQHGVVAEAALCLDAFQGAHEGVAVEQLGVRVTVDEVGSPGTELEFAL
jgi:hypothetical protein